MFGECHAHMIMDGINYKNAVSLHADGVKEEVIHRHFQEYRKYGITYIRDGGDSYGVSARARELSGLYGIEYRSPLFAIHKLHHYGGIVGRAFSDLREYHSLVLEAKALGADFIKIMTTGILDFNRAGEITGEPLGAVEVKEMVHIAHEEGMAVMSHTNGIYGIQAAIAAGVDSLEHGNFMDEETICQLAESRTIWVPTGVTIRNLIGSGRFEDTLLETLWEGVKRNITLAYRYGATVALGSDAGAYRVFHGKGIIDERDSFLEILGNTEEVTAWLMNGENDLRNRFVRK